MDQREVDLLSEADGKLYPVEFKKTGTPSQTASKHFHALDRINREIGHGAVICLIDRNVPLSKEVTAVPVGYL